MRLISKQSKVIFLSSILLCVAFTIFAVERKEMDTAFIKANMLYEQADYSRAILAYQSILDNGLAGGNIYYNLGNCYFKQNNLGKTILNYARADQLIPRDRDLQANYKYAKALIKRNIPGPAQLWVVRFANSFFSKFTIDGLTILLFGVYILLVIALGIGVVTRISKVKLFWIIGVLGVLFLVISVFGCKRVFYLNRNAIILEETVEAKFEPFDRAAVYFSLYEGMEVEIIAVDDQWVKIKRADKKVGWVKKAQLERI